jgi:hypothetical protein
MTSFVCFFAYAFDKSAAQQNRRRVPQSTLLVLGRAVDNPDLATSRRESAQHFIRSALNPETISHD